MGSIISYICELFEKVWQCLFGVKEKRILMIGLDAAGKTTLLYNYKLGKCIDTIPTVGFNCETVKYKNVNFIFWDVGGLPQIRPLWRHYFQGTDGVIFVIDSNDRERIGQVSEELYKVWGSEELKGAPLLILANKQDLPESMKVAEIVDKLNLHTVRGKEWFVQGTCGVYESGIFEGLEWLEYCLRKEKKKN